MWLLKKRNRTSSTSSSPSARPTLLQLQFLFIFVTVWVICITVSLTRRAACKQSHGADSLWVTLQKLAPDAVVGGAESGGRWYPAGGGGLINFFESYISNTTRLKSASHAEANSPDNKGKVIQQKQNTNLTAAKDHSIVQGQGKPKRKLLEVDSAAALKLTLAVSNLSTAVDRKSNLSKCNQFPETLVGLLRIPTSTSEWQLLLRGHMSQVSRGGHWSPTECVARQRVAIIIPYQDRPYHLRTFLHYMHPFLQRQQLDYTLFVVEQTSPETFNRAAVLDAGFLEVMKFSTYDCIIFHDVDLLPEHDHNKYECAEYPRHLAAFINNTNYWLNGGNVGGVLAITPDTMRLVNGFSTTFWGWGGEDDDMYMRITRHLHLRVERPDSRLGRYSMLPHGRDPHNPLNSNRLRGATYRGTRYSEDGLNSIRYRTLRTSSEELHTHITVALERPATSPSADLKL